jgi:hypothetical protein
MNDITVMAAAIVFVLAWYALALAGRAVFQAYEQMRLVWCPEARRFSFVEAEESTKTGSRFAVKRCALWPRYGRCKQGCVK